MGKESRFQYSYRKNASKLHKTVGDLLRGPDSPFLHFRVYQEYPVNRVNPDYPNGRHKFDWVILDLRLVIEVHGEQHERPVQFGGISYEEAHEAFVNQQSRDDTKAQAAIDAGFTYIAISHSECDSLTSAKLWELYQKFCNDSDIPRQKTTERSEYEQQQLDKAREYRKKRYRYLKELKQRGEG